MSIKFLLTGVVPLYVVWSGDVGSMFEWLKRHAYDQHGFGSINQSINLFICFVLQNEKYTNICEKKKVFESTGRQRNDHTVF